MDMTTIHSDGTRPAPSVFGALAYLVMNLVVGIGAFVVLVVLFTVGLGTAIIWVGLPLLALAVLLCRGGAHVERARVYALLDTYIAAPHRPLPEVKRWRARLKDGATWRGLGYFILLLPVGIAEFAIMVSLWSTSLALVFLPIYFRYLPDGELRLWTTDRPWLIVDTTVETLPFAAVGVLVLACTVALTKGMGAAHARFARAMLGQTVSGGVM
jgi:hypothetical protein